MQSSRWLAAVGLGITLGACASPSASTPQDSAFSDPETGRPRTVEGLAQGLTSQSGDRPMLLITMRKDATPLVHTQAFFEQRVFGPGYPNVKDFYSAASKNRFTFHKVGSVQVQDRPTDAALNTAAGVTSTMKVSDQRRARARQLAYEAGFRFKPYDANNDGRVDDSELLVLEIDNYDDGGAQTGGVPCVKEADGSTVCNSVSATGQKSELMNYAHEISHLLGATHLYGAWDQGVCNSYMETPESCTAGPSEGSAVYHFDPWNRRNWGWTAREFISNVSTSGSAKLAPVSTITSALPAPPYELVQLKRGGTSTESLMIEYRKADATYDRDVAAQGIVFWYLKEGSSGGVASVVSLTDSTKRDQGHFVLQSDRCVGDPMDIASRGETDLDTVSGGTYRFKWEDGTDTGLLFSVGNVASDGTITVSWSVTTSGPNCPENTSFGPTCGAASADVLIGANASVTSPDGNYTHPQCPHAFIGAIAQVAGKTAYATYAGPVTTPSFLGCGAMWVQSSLWKQSGTTFVKVADGPISYGVQFGTGCLIPRSPVTMPSTAGSYRLMGTAGAIFTYEPVTIGY
ncbi:MAG TPA: hypothetical protein VHM19_14630 [Polyangiales bacterium]|nr:hypothetical protein [Polyangiales bacterium]